jgi:coproporphyrinogen III oxidase-like Fe-S oxidoreductase
LRQEGIKFERFRERFGVDPREAWAGVFEELDGTGLLEVDGERATLTDAGLLVSNEIASRFIFAPPRRTRVPTERPPR